MIRRLEESHDNVIGYSFAGDVTEDEFTQVASELRDEIARHGTIRLLFRLRDFSLSNFFTALDERFRFVQEHSDDIERVAMVTDDTGAEILAKVSKTLGPVEMETYSSDEEPKAWAWLA